MGKEIRIGVGWWKEGHQHWSQMDEHPYLIPKIKEVTNVSSGQILSRREPW